MRGNQEWGIISATVKVTILKYATLKQGIIENCNA